MERNYIRRIRKYWKGIRGKIRYSFDKDVSIFKFVISLAASSFNLLSSFEMSPHEDINNKEGINVTNKILLFIII